MRSALSYRVSNSKFLTSECGQLTPAGVCALGVVHTIVKALHSGVTPSAANSPFTRMHCAGAAEVFLTICSNVSRLNPKSLVVGTVFG